MQAVFGGGRVGLGFELRVSHLQALYHLSHTSSPFISGYFGIEDLTNWLASLLWLA
jgi:hypothetical protein